MRAFVTVALAAALAAQAVAVGVRLVDAARGDPTSTRVSAASSARSVGPGRYPDVAGIESSHLFGSTPPQVASLPGDVPQASGLVLTGVVATRNPFAGSAILGLSVANAKLIAVGESSPDGSQLRSVYPDHVLLERNGRLEALSLWPHQKVRTRMVVVSRVAMVAQLAASRPALPSATVAGEPLNTTLVHAQPVVVDGRHGFQLSPGPGHFREFLHLGLHGGDVLTAVNGIMLDDSAASIRTVSSIGPPLGGSIVTVIRNGVQQDITLRDER